MMTSESKALHQSLSLVVVSDGTYFWIDVVQAGGGGGQVAIIGSWGAEPCSQEGQLRVNTILVSKRAWGC